MLVYFYSHEKPEEIQWVTNLITSPKIISTTNSRKNFEIQKNRHIFFTINKELSQNINMINKKKTHKFYVEDFGAKAKSGFDNTAAIRKALNSGKDIHFKKENIYEISDQINATLANQRIYGENATLLLTYNKKTLTGNISALNISDSKYSSLTNININIKNKSLEKQFTGIKISSSKNITLNAINIKNAGWTCISIYDFNGRKNQDIQIKNGRYEYCRFGIYSNSKGTIIKNNYISNHWSKSIEAKSKNPSIWENSPIDSEFYDGIIINNTDWVIDGNTIVDNGQSGIYSGNSSHGEIKNNFIKDNWNKGIDFGANRDNLGKSSISNIIIINNMVSNNKTGQVHLYKSDFNIIKYNKIFSTDTKYIKYKKYVNPAIILNSDNFSNIIDSNFIIQKYKTTSGIFSNKEKPESKNNIFSKNKIYAKIKYNINKDYNTVKDTSSPISKDN